MTAFDRALAWTLRWEGGYSNDAADPGGETNFGISKRAHPGVDIRNLTREQAAEIYRNEYWWPLRLDEVHPHRAAGKIFDMAVNMGHGRAVRCAQQALNYQVQRRQEVAVDGKMGANTISALNLFQGRLEEDLMLALKAYHAQHYLRLVELPSGRFEKFARGWLRRALTEEAA